ncbi:uncharacterized protein SEPMUDRAFT_39168 [Sphaerulina musiva SO2202]|uniref:Aminoglycoside phosphotransferase domain-containing protein n=1 Tax=Sphaerulina musiva (strain SO2202) TaxID=692275 RepID=M3CPG9_SPHMS|nr:uncharacterized protein SEPMUDRAFT_39168 [Sphaerulina musiva SO2202]EMF15643.1 hypothetical protein SEPMUDRAFT_39168 [Sphaerulina musiva SO2202]
MASVVPVPVVTAAEDGIREFLATTCGAPSADAHISAADLISSCRDDYGRGGHNTVLFLPVATQGGCSYTVVVVVVVSSSSSRSSSTDPGASRLVLQLRSLRYAVVGAILRDAARIFPRWAPKLIRDEILALGGGYLGDGGMMIQVLEMSFVGGMKFDDVVGMVHEKMLGEVVLSKLENLLGDMASFFATAYYEGIKHEKKEEEEEEKDESDEENRRSWQKHKCTGIIGSSIPQRLQSLEQHLPSPELRHIAHISRQSYAQGTLDMLPIVLNHGDLLPCNLLVDPSTWHLTGVVDWAEAEYLPFGMTLYGIEHLLGGYMYRDMTEMSPGGEGGGGKDSASFVFYQEANMLREMFWNQLLGRVHVFRRSDMWHAMCLSRTIGILLWHGIAWDGGKRDRVVDYQRDGEEVSCLEQMLGVTSSSSSSQSSSGQAVCAVQDAFLG